MVPLPVGESAKLTLHPASGIDVGKGNGKSRTVCVNGSPLGIVFDCRGRPLQPGQNTSDRTQSMGRWLVSIGAI